VFTTRRNWSPLGWSRAIRWSFVVLLVAIVALGVAWTMSHRPVVRPHIVNVDQYGRDVFLQAFRVKDATPYQDTCVFASGQGSSANYSCEVTKVVNGVRTNITTETITETFIGRRDFQASVRFSKF
jgi:hypothetical protein